MSISNTRSSGFDIINRLAGIALFLYIICTTAFENNPGTSKYATITLYSFILLSSFYILLKGKVKVNYYNIAIFIYGIFLMISWLYTPDKEYGLKTLYWYFTCGILTFLVINYIDTKEKINLIIKAYIIGGFVLCMLALKIYGWDIFNQIERSRYGIRVGGELGNENSIGLACGYSILFSVYLMMYTKLRKKFFLLYMIVIICCFILAMLTSSKKALVLIILGTILLFISKGTEKTGIFNRLKYLIISFVILFLFKFLLQNVKAFWYINMRVEEFINTIFGTGAASLSDIKRLHMIKQGLEVFRSNPYVGRGVAVSKYYFGTYSHNNYVEILMNTGAIGFIIYYSSYFISLIRLINSLNSFFLCSNDSLFTLYFFSLLFQIPCQRIRVPMIAILLFELSSRTDK